MNDPPSQAHRIKAASTLVDKLQATSGSQALLRELVRVIHKTEELQRNATRLQDKTTRTESFLSAEEIPGYDDHRSPEGPEAGDLRQQITILTAQGLTIHDRLSFGPDFRDHLQARTMERYGPNYEAPIPRLTSGIAPPCFGYEVITHQFP